MQAHFLLGPIPTLIASSSSSSAIGFCSSLIADSLHRTYFFNPTSKSPNRFPQSNPVIDSWSAAVDGDRNHYQMLGVAPATSSTEIKKAFRLLARKYHPDVSKDLRAVDAFKSIRHAYEVLANEVTRAQYDRSLKLQESTDRRFREKRYYSPDFEERSRNYRWAELKQKIQYERYQKYYSFQEDSSDQDDEEEGSNNQLRSPFLEVLKSTFLSLFLLQTFGSRLSLTFSSVIAMLDEKLDAGYKIGYLVAWLLGGRAGVLLAICLSFASWVCGKSSSNVVAVVVVAMWVGSNLAICTTFSSFITDPVSFGLNVALGTTDAKSDSPTTSGEGSEPINYTFGIPDAIASPSLRLGLLKSLKYSDGSYTASLSAA